MKTNVLIIFTRNPQLGKVKTRLAKTIGDEKALQVYTDLLAHTMNVTQYLACDKFVFYDRMIVENDIWADQQFYKKEQSGVDLGARMQNAFEQLFELGYEKSIIIGSDLFDLTANHIHAAFKKLDNSDVVLGPAEDGGYYLLGLKKVIPSVFINKNWGTSTVLGDTMGELGNYHVECIETLNDIDTFEDLEKSKYYQNRQQLNGKV